MKYEIMIQILFELLSKKCVSASYLSDKYEISRRTVYRYIEGLEYAGVPLYTIRGNNGGFSIIDTYKLSSTFLTKKEFDATVNALSAISDSVPDKTLNNVIVKLKATTKNEYSGFDLKSGNLIIDAGPWGDTVGYKSKLITIEKAIDENKKLEITYHDRNGKITKRITHPHIIVFKQGLWYVFSYCELRKEFRFFKTGRIESAKILDENFVRQDLSNMDLPLNFWHNSVNSEEVVMQIESKCLSDVEEWLGIENVKEENGKFIARAKLPFDNGLTSKIISFGDGIKVLSPIELQKIIKETIKNLSNIYK